MSRNEEWLKDEELTPCANCGKPHAGLIRVLDINVAAVDQRALRERHGLSELMGSEPLARVMGAYPNLVRLNQEPALKTRLLLCGECFCQDLNLAVLVEKAYEEAERKAGVEAEVSQR